MAGIGFVLRKLYRQDNLSGLVKACFHSAIASAGPWLFTVIALATIVFITNTLVSHEILFNFRVVLIYNFSFSLVLSGPIYMVATRYLADSIYKRDVSGAPGMLVGTLVLMWGVELLCVCPFYFLYAQLSPAMALSAVADFLLLSAVWLAGIFISALKDYKLITRAFLIGMAVSVAACVYCAKPFGAVGMLNGFSSGLVVITALLVANVFAEYPYPVREPFAFTRYFRDYWEIALSGLIYNMAIWVDKWIMWFSPDATRISGLPIYPFYDSAMFLAFLTTIPAMAMFLFSSETQFYEHYVRFYRDIEGKASLARIEKNHQAIMKAIFGSAGHFFLLQGSIALLCLLMSPQIITLMHANFLQIGIFRYGLIGALFQVLTMFLLVLLSHFDSRKSSLAIQAVFLVTNALFTWGSMRAGFPYYGYGYFLSSLVTFILAAVILTQYVKQLPYHTFITANTSAQAAQ